MQTMQTDMLKHEELPRQLLDTKPTEVWGLPLMPWTLSQALEGVEQLIERGEPSYFITANVHYAMLTAQNPDLDPINRKAAFILADGMPLVWASRKTPCHLPERVAGSDLIFALSEQASRLGHRLFLLGGQPGVGETAANNLKAQYPGLEIVGVESPPFRPLSNREKRELFQRIRTAKPDLLMVAFGQPRGERWIAENYLELEVPASVQVGASIDFAAGRVRRAPKWIQKAGLEWIFRFYLEPKRLGLRYLSNGIFALKQMGGDLCKLN